MVKRELPASVLRCTCIVGLADDPRPHTLQIVGRRAELTPTARDAATNESLITAGGQHNDQQELTALFDRCHADRRDSR